jgi:histidinol-phosphate phosphatase family protein
MTAPGRAAAPSRVTARPAVFVDRDGVLNELWYEPDLGTVDSPLRPDQVRLTPHAVRGVRMLNEANLPCVVVSNQPVVAKGKTSIALLEQVTRRLVTELAAGGATLDGVYYCLHHPQARQEALRRRCPHRKPLPGLLRRAAADLHLDLARSWMVGDTAVDIRAGRAAGCSTAWVGVLRCDTCPTRHGAEASDLVAADLAEAVAGILAGSAPDPVTAGRAGPRGAAEWS